MANRNEEFSLPNNNDKDSNKIDRELVTRTRSRRISRPYNWGDKFPETAHL